MSNDRLHLSRVTVTELGEVEAVFGDLRTYSVAIGADGSFADMATEFTTALPSGVRMEDKHSFVSLWDRRPVGLLDVINGYPAPGTAFIGLLAVRESCQGGGLGTALYRQAEKFIRGDLGALRISLAVVETNPVGGFWRRMGFVPTGEARPYEDRSFVSRAILMEKPTPLE